MSPLSKRKFAQLLFTLMFSSMFLTTSASAQSPNRSTEGNANQQRLTATELKFLKEVAPDQVEKSKKWTSSELAKFRQQFNGFTAASSRSQGIVNCELNQRKDGCSQACEGKQCRKAYWFWESDGWCRSRALNSFGSACGCDSFKPKTNEIR